MSIPIVLARPLECRSCGSPIIYALNRDFAFSIGETSTQLDFGGREVETAKRGIVGDLCERCYIDAAPPELRPGVEVDRQILEAVRSRVQLPPAATFQRLVAYPRRDDPKLAGFEWRLFGVWIEPNPDVPFSMRIDIPNEGVSQLTFFFQAIRCDGIAAELHREWNMHGNRVIDEIKDAAEATIPQLQRLMEGFRFRTDVLSVGSIRRGGPRKRPIDYATVCDLWQKLDDEWRDRHDRDIRQDEFVEQLREHTGVSLSVKTLRRRLSEWGKTWPPVK